MANSFQYSTSLNIITWPHGSRFGDSTNMHEISSSGVVTYLGGAGLNYGEISVQDSAVVTEIASTGYVQITNFNRNGLSNGGVTPDHTNDHISIGVKGTYDVNISLAVNNNSAQSYIVDFDVFTNDGTTQLINLHSHRTLDGGSTSVGSISMNGFVALSSSDTIELWAHLDTTGSRSLTVEDATLTVTQIGGSTA